MTASRNLSAGVRTQRGVALAMALVVLVILTLLGVSAMKSSSLELKMASGIQDNTMVFQAADSGLAEAFRTAPLNETNPATTSFTSTSGISSETETNFVQRSELGANETPSSKDLYEYANWENTSTAISSSGAKVTVHQGVRRTVAKKN